MKVLNDVNSLLRLCGEAEEVEDGGGEGGDGDVGFAVGEAEAADVGVAQGVVTAGGCGGGPQADGYAGQKVGDGAADDADDCAGKNVAGVVHTQVDARVAVEHGPHYHCNRQGRPAEH